ncbi:MAG: hypothetical protein ACI3YT_07110 [Prevotella sp.]
MADNTFNIIDHLAGLTPYVFDISVLKRVAYDCGVIEVMDYSELTREQTDMCKIALLETLVLNPYQTASQTSKHGEWQEQTGSQTTTAKNIEAIKTELKRLYKEYGLDEKLEALENEGANLEWME